MISWRRAASFGCSRWSIPSPASRRRWSHDSSSAAPTSWRYWKGFAMKWDSRQRSVSIKAPSSSRAIWITLDFSRPGKPTDNAFIEAFNGRFRAECLNAHWFLTLDDARTKLEDWRKYCNEVRPHGAIGNKPPITLQNYEGAPSSPS